MKICSKCNTKKPYSEFYKKIRYPDGYDYTCKHCQRAQDSTRNSKRNITNKVGGRKFKKEYVELKKGRYLHKNGLITDEEFNQIKTSYGLAVKKDKRRIASIIEKRRVKEDPSFRAMKNVRNRVRNFLFGKSPYSKSLGCSYEEFRRFIENQFEEGMSWDNYGEWELDHVVPLALAYLQGTESFKYASSYLNIKPLWKSDHKEKTKSDMRKVKDFKSKSKL